MRTAPTTDAPIVLRMQRNDQVLVHGRTNHEREAWSYVTHIQTGESGWVFDPNWDAPYLNYDEGILRRELPIISLDYIVHKRNQH